MKKRNLFWLLSLMLVVALSFPACGDDEDDPVTPDPNPSNQTDTTKQNNSSDTTKQNNSSDTTKQGNSTDSTKQDVVKIKVNNSSVDDEDVATITGDNLSQVKEIKFGDAVLDFKLEGTTITFAVSTLPSGEQTVLLTYEDSTGNTQTEEVKITVPESVEEVIDADNVKVQANGDGTIIVQCDVATNAKLKVFELQDSDGIVVYDFLGSNEQVKEKIKSIDGNARVTQKMVFNLTGITSPALPVDNYTLVIKTKTKKVEERLGEVIEYKIGAAKSEIGVYLSIVNNHTLTYAQARELYDAAEVIAVSSPDGYTVEGLKRATEAKNSDIAAYAGKVTLLQDGNVVSQVGEGGVIITKSGVICKIISIENDASGVASIKMATYKSVGGLVVDVSSVAFDYAHNISDLEGTWVWETIESEDFCYECEVYIKKVSDTEFNILNFVGLEDTIRVSVSGTSLSFSGTVADGNLVITNGTGTIANGFKTINISFEYNAGDGQMSASATLYKGSMIAKKK